MSNGIKGRLVKLEHQAAFKKYIPVAFVKSVEEIPFLKGIGRDTVIIIDDLKD